jgi:hypothetical protein
MTRGILEGMVIENVINIAASAEKVFTSSSTYEMSRDGIPNCCTQRC